MRNNTSFRNQSHENSVELSSRLWVDSAHRLPPVPALLETLLLLDLESQELSIDLRGLSELVLGDLGATVQILRLAGQEYGCAEGRPNRIEDCISDMGVHACIEAVSTCNMTGKNCHDAIEEAWSHAREIAQFSRLIAEDVPEVNPDEAYLVGLLHSIGTLPVVLGWRQREQDADDSVLTGSKMARQWMLPGFVQEFFSALEADRRPTVWSEIVQMAHLRAKRSHQDCPFDHQIRPYLYRNIQSGFAAHALAIG